MAAISPRTKIWGWFFFDWASQPYNTLLLTFVFGPFLAGIVAEALMTDGLSETAAKAQAQGFWALGQTVAGLIVAFSAPLLGAVADTSGRRLPWVRFFSVLYVCGSFALWWTNPDGSNATLMLIAFGIGFVGMELAHIFVNSLLPDLGGKDEIGQISGSGFAFGYWGGVLSLTIMLLFFRDDASGKTLIGLDPPFGLNASEFGGTRFVGPFVALWYAAFMVLFFRWVKEPAKPRSDSTVGKTLQQLWQSIRNLGRSLAMYLLSSMVYRDALNGLYGFGGVYAKLVLDWSIMQIGIFGIVGAVSAAVFSWIGGRADRVHGPKPVIATCIVTLALVCLIVAGMGRDTLFGLPLAAGSGLPDAIFLVCGAIIGAAGGAIQASSRSLMVRHANLERPTEAFGLYALSGRATAFVAPAMIGIVTTATGNARLGMIPLIALFMLGLALLGWVNLDGDRNP